MAQARFPKKFSSKFDLNISRIYEYAKKLPKNSYESLVLRVIESKIKNCINENDAIQTMKQLFVGLRSLDEHVIDKFIGSGANGIVFSLQDLPEYYLKLSHSCTLQDSLKNLGGIKTSYSEYSKLGNTPNIHANVLSSESNGTIAVSIIEKVNLDVRFIFFDELLGNEADDVGRMARINGRQSKQYYDALNDYWSSVDALQVAAERETDVTSWFSTFLTFDMLQQVMDGISFSFKGVDPNSAAQSFYEFVRNNADDYRDIAEQYLNLSIEGTDAHHLNFGTRENNPNKLVGFDI